MTKVRTILVSVEIVLLFTIVALLLGVANGCDDKNDPNRNCYNVPCTRGTPRPTWTGPIIHQPAPKSGDPDYTPLP